MASPGGYSRCIVSDQYQTSSNDQNTVNVSEPHTRNVNVSEPHNGNVNVSEPHNLS